MSSHDKQWSTNDPGLLVFLLDQSGSMTLPFKNTNIPRTEFASRAINHTIHEVINKNNNGLTPKDRCHIMVIGYSTEAKILCYGSLSELQASPLRLEVTREKNKSGIYVDKTKPIWVEPVYEDGCTNMAAAFIMAQQFIEEWINDRPDTPAPVIINISDGVPYYGGYPSQECADETALIAREVANIKSNDGNVLIFNAEIGSSDTPIVLPTSIDEVNAGGEGARFLYHISSVIPEGYEDAARKNGLPLRVNARGAVFAADADTLINLINFGSSKGMTDFF